MPPRRRPRRASRSRRGYDRFVIERVQNYLSHMQNAAYVRAAFAHDQRRAVRTLARMLRSGDNQTANDALLFAEDAVLYGMLPRRQALDVWGALLPELRSLLRAPDRNLRRNAVISLGRVGPRSNVQHYAAVFPLYLERDPLTLPALVSETLWLGDSGTTRGFAKTIAEHSLYLVRWSLLQWASQSGKGWPAWKAALIERLTADPHPLIREEAAALLARWEAEARWTWPRDRSQALADVDERVAELQRLAPALGFGDVWIRFSNYLSVTGQRDYDIATLDAFVGFESTHALPTERPFDLIARAREFEDWRAARGG